MGDGAFGVAPGAEGVDAAADEDEAIVFDELVMDGLDGNVFAFEVRLFDGFGDVGEVHWFFFGF